jgi:hypothetical protein
MTMRALVLALALLTPLLTAAGAEAKLTYQTSPGSIVLGQANRVTITVQGLPGTGPVQAAVNVGSVQRVEARAADVVVHYRTPKAHYPQRLCLILRRGGVKTARVLRIPLLGQTLAPVKTRKRSQVTLTVAGKVFGPKSSGPHGRVSIRVVVPPGTTEGRVEVIDEKGMETQKTVPIQLPSYNPLAVAVEPALSAAKVQDYVVIVATSEIGLTGIELSVRRVSPAAGEAVSVPLVRGASGLWTAAWRPKDRGRYAVEARISNNVKTADLSWQPPWPEDTTTPVVKKAAPRPEPGFFDRLTWDVSLAAGVMHNTGELLSPHISVEAGATYPALGGRVGARLLLGVSWGSQQVTDKKVTSETSSSVILLPLGLALTYRLPLSFGLTPHLTAGPLLQLVRTSNDGDESGQVSRTDVAFGVVGLLGASYRLGPGGLMLQGGYLWSQLENDDVVLQAGGVVAELGYRLEF